MDDLSAGTYIPSSRSLASSYSFRFAGKTLERTINYLAQIDTVALSFACRQATGIDEDLDLRILDMGGYNVIYQATFRNLKSVVVRIPMTFTPGVIASTVATMTYARHRLNIPCPAVFAWNDQPDNVVGLPYIIMEMVEGKRLDTVWKGLNPRNRYVALKCLLDEYVLLSAKQPFNTYGRLVFDEARLEASLRDFASYRVTKLTYNVHPRADDKHIPFDVQPAGSIRDMWVEAFHANWAAMRERWEEKARALEVREEGSSWDSLALIRRNRITSWNTAQSAAKNLMYIIKKLDIPAELESQCLVLGDFALRNVMYNESTAEITGIIDWDDAAILPAVLLKHHPAEFEVDMPNTDENDDASENLRRLLLGDWTPLTEKPGNWYTKLDEDVHGTEFTIQVSELLMADDANQDAKWQQRFVEQLRYVKAEIFSGEHLTKTTFLGLSTHCNACRDAWKVHNLLLAGFSSWVPNEKWLQKKADSIKLNRLKKLTLKKGVVGLSGHRFYIIAKHIGERANIFLLATLMVMVFLFLSRRMVG